MTGSNLHASIITGNDWFKPTRLHESQEMTGLSLHASIITGNDWFKPTRLYYHMQ